MYLSRVWLKPEISKSSQLGRLLQSRTYGTHQLLWDLFSDSSRFLYREEVAGEQRVEHAGLKGAPIYYLLSEAAPAATVLFEVESRPFAPQLRTGQRLAFKVRVNPVVTRQKQRHDLVMDEQLRLFKELSQCLGLPKGRNKKALKTELLENKNAEALQEELQRRLSGTSYAWALSDNPSAECGLEMALRHSVTLRLGRWLAGNPSREGIFELAQRTCEDPFNDTDFEVLDLQYTAYQKHSLPEKGRKAGFCSVDLSGELIVRDTERFIDMLKQGIGPAKGFGCGLMMIKPA
ncbi:MAG: type I-E CRISPR-associated protein Cas6/Cse3/CasE [Oceanospirillaceae bacterium]|nr:type I-E CRISPR-associated protein Cas6/Cse3/CasE [Oceanospirillaceae bacterium]